ncbi:ATP-binding protein [Streptomyces sp. NPDC002144]
MNPHLTTDAWGVVWGALTASRPASSDRPFPATALPRYEQRLSASWILPGRSLHTPRAARTHLIGTCRTWRVPREVTDSLALITSELTTNAVVHAHGEEITLSLMLSAHHAWVTVSDQGRPRSPIDRSTATEDAENGRGLCLVEALASHWQATTCPGGTRVWACLALPRRVPATAAHYAAPATAGDRAERPHPDDDPPHPQRPKPTTPTLRMTRCPNR